MLLRDAWLSYARKKMVTFTLLSKMRLAISRGIVVVEIPAKAEWCELRKIVFAWTEVQFPFRVRSGRKLKLIQPPVITVIGKAFFDIGHAPADHSNRKTDLQGYAAWEIHPVMKLTVQ